MRRLGASAVLLATACVAEPSYPPVQWKGEHVEFGSTRADEEICSGTLEYLDAFAGVAKSRVGSTSQLTYYWVSESELDEYCVGDNDENRVGCAKPDGTVFASDAADDHELVHGARAEFDFSHRFVEEGVATAWGLFPTFVKSSPDRSSTLTVMQDAGDGMSGEDYLLAADFVEFILQTEGYAPLGTVTSDTDYSSGYESLNTALESSIGLSTTDLVSVFVDEPSCAPRDFSETLVGCNSPVIGEVGNLELTVDLSCDSEGVVGPTEGRMFVQRTFSVPEAGTYLCTLQGPEDGDDVNEVFLRRCGSGCSPAQTISADAEPPFDVSWLELEAGTYVITFARDIESPANYVFSCSP